MKKNIYIVIMALTVGSLCHAQENISANDVALIKMGLLYQAPKSSTFSEFVKLFPERKFPLKYKDNAPTRKKALISKDNAIKYLHFSEENLKMNDYLYNYDDDIKTDRWVKTLPTAGFKIQQKKYIALTYSLQKLPTIETETYNVWLTTFTYQGSLIDSITIRKQYTYEEDWIDFVFITDKSFKIFQYMPNLENYKAEELKKGTYDPIDLEGSMTVVEINDYQIDENGKISLIKTHPKKYLQEFVSFYRSYHKDSDDPMNEY